MIVISDTSVLVGLAAAQKLDLLQKLWKVVFIPQEVLREIKPGKPGHAEVQAAIAAGWLKVKPHGGPSLSMGEDGCLFLARELNAGLVLVDDEKARKKLSAAGFTVSGAVGVLVAGLRHNHVDGQEIPPIIQVWEKLGFRLSRELARLLQEEAPAVPLQNPRDFYDDWDDPEVDAAWHPKKK